MVVYFQKAERLFGYSVSTPKVNLRSISCSSLAPMHRRRRQPQPDSRISLTKIQEQSCFEGFIFKAADWSQLPLLWSSKSTIGGAEEEEEEEGMENLGDEMNPHGAALYQLILDDNF